MDLKDEIIKLEMDDEFRICPSCGYNDGFHSMFKKEEGVTKWIFICPQCYKCRQVFYDRHLIIKTQKVVIKSKYGRTYPACATRIKNMS